MSTENCSVSSSGSSDRTLAFGILNANSVGSKYVTICNEITDRKLDVCLLTETHHSSTRDTSLLRCVPANCVLHDVPRPSKGANDRNYGGVAAIINSRLKYHEIKSSARAETFESLAFTVSGQSTVAVLLIYRPGSQQVSNLFFDELTRYLETLALYKCQIVVAGDLNIHIERKDDTDALRLLDLLSSFDCIQHVQEPTHTRGGTLDHVFTRRDEAIFDVNVDPAGVISDHSFIIWN